MAKLPRKKEKAKPKERGPNPVVDTNVIHPLDRKADDGLIQQLRETGTGEAKLRYIKNHSTVRSAYLAGGVPSRTMEKLETILRSREN